MREGSFKMGKGAKIAVIAVVIALTAAGIGVGVANALNAENQKNIEFYQDHIFDKTSVGGIDVSRLTAEEAAEKVNTAISGVSATVVDGDESTTFTAADADVSQVPESFFSDIVSSQNSQEWKEKCAEIEEHEILEVEYDLGKLEKAVAKMNCVSGKDRKDAVDAQLKLEGGKFEIVAGQEGTRVDADLLTDLVMEKLSCGAYKAESAESSRANDRSAAVDAVSKAKEDYKKLRASFTDDDKDGWDDASDVIIADALAEAQAKIDAAEEALAKVKEASGNTDGSYDGKKVKLDGISVGAGDASDGMSDDIIASDYYEQPLWTGEESEFQNAQDKAKKWLGAEIDYTIDMIPHAAKVDSKVIQDFIIVNQDKIDVELDEDAMATWLHETCKDYDTVGTTRQYTTPSGANIDLSGGHYGWMTDEAAELPKLAASIEAGEKVSRDMSYEQMAAGPKGGKEWGDTYIDIDITEQIVRYIKDGEVVFSADTVTGTEIPARMTQRGFYSILWKDSPHVMVGEIDPRTGRPEYETPCSYFILFNSNGSACHDADHIRSNWSKSAHFGSGSHGCANMHYKDVQTLWNLCENGDPVIVHD